MGTIEFEKLKKGVQTMKRFFNFVFGAVLGGMVGGTVALLFAPMKGEVLRQKLNEYIVEVKGEVTEAAMQKRIEMEEELSTLRKAPTKK
jgi:gas vesicle protein